jgi:hypothetical protein
VAISVIGKMLESAGCQVEPYVYYPPEDERHVPAYIVALARQRSLWELQNLHPHPRSQFWPKLWAKFEIFWTPFQYIIGAVLSICAIAIVFWAISNDYTEAHTTPIGTGFLVVFLLIVIAYSEGYHVTIITLEKADSNVFKESHPRGFRAHQMANENAESFLVGRQVMLTGIVFIFAHFTVFEIPDDVDWLFFSNGFLKTALTTGVACSLIVLAFGQLLPQLIATSYPVHHMSLPGGNIIIWLMLFVDRIGVANIGFWGAYVWRQCAGIMVNEEFGVGGEVVFGVDAAGSEKATPNQSENQSKRREVVSTAKSGEAEANPGAQVGSELTAEIRNRVRKDPIEITKAIMSCALMLGTTAMAVKNIVEGNTGIKAHPAALIVIHIVLLICMTYLEGMNLCVLALEKVPNEQIALINPGAVASHKLIIGGNGDPVKRFLLGRQFCVVWMDFLIHQISGLWGLAITVFLAQVMSQIVAATNPAYWMALPGARFMLLLSLAIEKLGVCHFGWFLGIVAQKIGEVVGILQPEPYSVGMKVDIKGTQSAKSGPVDDDAML